MGTSLSTISLDAASQADVSHKAGTIKQQQQQHHTPLTAYAADSASSISGSHMEAEQELKQGPKGRKLFATVRDGLFKKPWLQFGASLVLSGIPTYTSAQQAAVHAAYDEVMAGSQQRFEDLYQMGHMLGSGHYARVHVAKTLQDGSTYAAKVLPKVPNNKGKARQQLQSVVKEVAVMRLLADHPSAVKLHQVLQDQQHFYLVMDTCAGGELFDYAYKLDHLPEAEAAQYMQHLASFMAYAHSRHIVHRDIKPENMLLAPMAASDGSAASPWRLKVIDYGCSAFCMPQQKLHDAVGTVCYVAPEVLWHNYDSQSDVWSAGVVLYMLLSGYLPFDGSNNEETLMLVRAGDVDMEPEDWAHVSQAGQDLVKQLLAYKPADRPTAAQLLQHSWLQHRAAADSTTEAETSPAGEAQSATAAADKSAATAGAVSVKATTGAPTSAA